MAEKLTAIISSTVLDLTDYREEVMHACLCKDILPKMMDHLPALDADAIAASLALVDNADIYIGIFAHCYGYIPKENNPKRISITEMEYDRAVERNIPRLMFLMDENQPVKPANVDKGASNRKLKALKNRVNIERVRDSFTTKEDLRGKIIHALDELKKVVESGQKTHPKEKPIPKPPALYAEPDYIGSHRFVGRDSQLQELSDWAKPADPTTVLLFEAIGGNGKSMLTWEWTNYHATRIRSDWAGRFWYSFYERGAVMADFCRCALAYTTGQSMEDLRKKKTPEMAGELLTELHSRPWLLILDGLERVLVAYNRIDAAEVLDEEINQPTDKIVNRDPRSAIRDEDEDLLRSLAVAAPSKILISSRLTPRVLLNSAGQPIPGVRRIDLPGLRPPDAEKLLCSCGITGNSAAIQNYLSTNCGCHPLVIGALAGLINNYLPDKGNFDAWVAAPEGGGQFNLASLNLIQRRNHILLAAITALSEKSAQLLSTLALLSESADYPTLAAINPFLPQEPQEVPEPSKPEQHWRWDAMSDADKAEAQESYKADLTRRKEYEMAVKARLASAEFRAAPGELTKAVSDLEHRGLLQYDGRTKRYDLHPVVRAVAAEGLKSGDKERYGQRVVDYFSQQPHNPYEEAETLEDVRIGLNLVCALIKIGRFQEATNTYRGDLSNALFFNLEAYSEALSLLRPFFSMGWGELPNSLRKSDATYLTNGAAIALDYSGESKEALSAYVACLSTDLEMENWRALVTRLQNILQNLTDQNLLAKSERVCRYASELAAAIDNQEDIFLGRYLFFSFLSRAGRHVDADNTWQLLNPMGRDWSRAVYRPGSAEIQYANFQFWKGTLLEDYLVVAEHLANEGKNRLTIRDLYFLRGAWRLQQGDWTRAAESFQEAVRMARERGIPYAEAETGLALAKFRLGQLADPRTEAERLAQARKPAHRLLAMLWLAIGDHEQAKKHALAAYHWAWADGEPYVRRYELTQTTALLQQLGVPIPNLPPYDPAKDEKFPWEDAVVAAIEKLCAAKEAEKTEET